MRRLSADFYAVGFIGSGGAVAGRVEFGDIEPDRLRSERCFNGVNGATGEFCLTTAKELRALFGAVHKVAGDRAHLRSPGS